jgi:drug/metabolite transporter (DMT)-like permease
MMRFPTFLLAAVTFLWGSTFVVTKDIVRSAPPCGYAALRFFIATVALSPLLFRRKFDRQAMRDGLLLGVLSAFALSFQVIGQAYTTASKSAFITSLNTPLTPVVGLIFYRLRPTRAEQAAVIAASVGLFLLTWPGASGPLNFGDLITLACATLYAVYIVESARRLPSRDPVVMTFLQVAAMAVVFTTMHFVLTSAIPSGRGRTAEIIGLESRPLFFSAKVFAQIFYMSIVCGALALLGQSWAIGRIDATRAALVFALEPVFATLIALCVEGISEWPGARGVHGALLVLSALLIAQVRGSAARKEGQSDAKESRSTG